MKVCDYKINFPIDERREQYNKLQKNSKYIDKVPCICILSDSLIKKRKDKDQEELYKKGYFKILSNKDITVSQMIAGIRKKIEIDPTESIILFSENNTILSSGNLLCQAYQLYKDEEDSFLYITISVENTFGRD